MKIKSLCISGYDEMVRSIFISNKHYTDDIDNKIRDGERIRVMLEHNLDDGNISPCTDPRYQWYRQKIETAIKLACGSLYTKADDRGAITPEQIQQCHSTIGRFLDISCVVDGLHRGATDDFDAHAKRLESRIVRLSTRTTSPKDIELSDWYKGKVIPFGDLDGSSAVNADTNEAFTFNFPETIKTTTATYHKSRFGYVQDGYEKNYDVLRGLTPLGMSNLFIFKCNITEWAHITKLRRPGTHASPELQELIQMINTAIEEKEPLLNDDFWRYCIQ